MVKKKFFYEWKFNAKIGLFKFILKQIIKKYKDIYYWLKKIKIINAEDQNTISFNVSTRSEIFD